MTYWQPISTVPKCGMIIELTATDDDAIVLGPHKMYWNPEAKNPLVGDIKGMWVDYKERYTWDESKGFGPTQWRICDESNV